MTDTTHLTNPIPLRDIERATENGNEFFAKLARQLLAAMQREERLRQAGLSIILGVTPYGDDASVIKNRHIRQMADALKDNRNEQPDDAAGPK